MGHEGGGDYHEAAADQDRRQDQDRPQVPHWLHGRRPDRQDRRELQDHGDVKGHFTVHRITASEAAYKLCRVRAVSTGPKGVPYLHTSDGRTIRYPDPNAKVNDSIQLDLATNKVQDIITFEVGNLCMVTGGANAGRVGTMISREKHPGSFDIVHIKDSQGHVFATRLNYVFVIGKGNKPFISLPKGKGVKLSIAEERDKRLGVKA